MSDRTVGLLGYGKIGRYLHERINQSSGISVDYVFSKEVIPADDRDDVDVVTADDMVDRPVDLVVEAAAPRAVHDYGPAVLETADLAVLSTTALASQSLHRTVETHCEDHGTTLFVPHAAVLGLDGLVDARSTVETVRIETRKHPDNIDFSADDGVEPAAINGEVTLFDGPTREICAQYPRNVNSHATVALAGIGFDDTQSQLVADPSTSAAIHQITADGEGTTLEITRSTRIEGVTGEYTLASIWGSVRRILSDGPGITIV